MNVYILFDKNKINKKLIKYFLILLTQTKRVAHKYGSQYVVHIAAYVIVIVEYFVFDDANNYSEYA
jgi:hypothetical protein